MWINLRPRGFSKPPFFMCAGCQVCRCACQDRGVFWLSLLSSIRLREPRFTFFFYSASAKSRFFPLYSFLFVSTHTHKKKRRFNTRLWTRELTTNKHTNRKYSGRGEGANNMLYTRWIPQDLVEEQRPSKRKKNEYSTMSLLHSVEARFPALFFSTLRVVKQKKKTHLLR